VVGLRRTVREARLLALTLTRASALARTTRISARLVGEQIGEPDQEASTPHGFGGDMF
jgi:hypothetical protein